MAELVVSIVAIVLSLVSGGFTFFTYRKAVEHDRKQATLEAYERLLQEALEPLDMIRPAQINEILQDNKSAEYKKLTTYMSKIETFCVGVHHRIYDYEVAYELSHGYMDGRIWNRIERVLDKKNEWVKEGHYQNTELVIRRMRRRSGYEE